jgi:hypothetical protein
MHARPPAAYMVLLLSYCTTNRQHLHTLALPAHGKAMLLNASCMPSTNPATDCTSQIAPLSSSSACLAAVQSLLQLFNDYSMAMQQGIVKQAICKHCAHMGDISWPSGLLIR